jgi:hypothetical protein
MATFGKRVEEMAGESKYCNELTEFGLLGN